MYMVAMAFFCCFSKTQRFTGFSPLSIFFFDWHRACLSACPDEARSSRVLNDKLKKRIAPDSGSSKGEKMLKLIGAFFVCLWAADFVTGLAHWLEDTYCLEDYPLIGSFICEPNIEHHVNPTLMVRSGTFFSRNILQWSLCGGMFGLLWIVGFGNAYTFTTLLMASFGNEIHRWNHMSKTGSFVTFMKDSGLIQVQKQHSLHHKQPHNQYYCVMTSLLNSVLERINFWRKLEWVVKATTGIAPKRENRRDSQPLKKQPKKSKPQSQDLEGNKSKPESNSTMEDEALPKQVEAAKPQPTGDAKTKKELKAKKQPKCKGQIGKLAAMTKAKLPGCAGCKNANCKKRKAREAASRSSSSLGNLTGKLATQTG